MVEDGDEEGRLSVFTVHPDGSFGPENFAALPAPVECISPAGPGRVLVGAGDTVYLMRLTRPPATTAPKTTKSFSWRLRRSRDVVESWRLPRMRHARRCIGQYHGGDRHGTRRWILVDEAFDRGERRCFHEDAFQDAAADPVVRNVVALAARGRMRAESTQKVVSCSSPYAEEGTRSRGGGNARVPENLRSRLPSTTASSLRSCGWVTGRLSSRRVTVAFHFRGTFDRGMGSSARGAATRGGASAPVLGADGSAPRKEAGRMYRRSSTGIFLSSLPCCPQASSAISCPGCLFRRRYRRYRERSSEFRSVNELPRLCR